MYGTNADRTHRGAAPGARARFVSGSALLGAAALLLTACSSSSSGSSDSSDSSDGGSSDGNALKQRPKAQAPYWVNPDGSAAEQAEEYREGGKEEKAALIEEIAEQPVAEWIGTEDPEAETRALTEDAEKADREALLVLYNLPHRDCGQYSQGGAGSGDEYREWLGKVIDGIGDRAATVVVEPDALPHLLQEGCTPEEFHEERYSLLKESVEKLTELPHTKVYLDAGNPDWVRDPGGLVEPLHRAGIEAADGFALNVSNYQSTTSNVAYGKKLSAMVGDKPFVVDTSRNGNGPAKGSGEETWCNPPGRALGEEPTTETGDELVDAYLWIKRPGESDGTCKGGPKAGEWFPEYALDLARNADG
ncbi:glycoside hydrolase family 6 protein [Streptomyces sp. N2-109]|uniref:Glucanase n=1 Tax=Streptomyces gossypii TaxID=2883101 RepID=A0ABT2JTJ1_9ACTN|nr:glycoside hydrolase family 6 protein [Streptomyces gossypii]MCT2591209.1 glycoside hydrolase family 6 protein [Streptomyces gossypii]